MSVSQRRHRSWPASVVRAAPLAAVLLASSAVATAAGPRYEVCEQQVRSYVEQRLGQTIRHIDFDWRHEVRRDGQYEPSTALVYPNECDGYHWFELLASPDTCRFVAHYGTPPDYLYYRGSTGSCAAGR